MQGYPEPAPCRFEPTSAWNGAGCYSQHRSPGRGDTTCHRFMAVQELRLFTNAKLFTYIGDLGGAVRTPQDVVEELPSIEYHFAKDWLWYFPGFGRDLANTRRS